VPPEGVPRRVPIARSPFAVAGVCALVSLLVRWWVHHDLYAHDPLLAFPLLDDAYYLETAARMARGEAFDWFLAPLHPWLASVVSGGQEISIRLLGTLGVWAGGLTSGVVALAACRIARGSAAGWWAGWVAGLGHALAGVFAFHDVLPGQEAAIGLFTAVAVLCGAVLIDDRTSARGGVLSAGGLGIAVGLAAMARGSSLLLLLCAAPGLVRGEGRAMRGAVLGAGLLLALTPGIVRNLSVAGTLSPFPSSGGANLYLANGPDARAEVAMTSRELGGTPWTIEARSSQIASAAEGRSLTAREASSWWIARTFREWGGVGATLGHMGRKAVLFFSADERGSNHSAHAEREYATYTRVVPVAGWWILALGVGAWWLVRRTSPRADVAALAILGTWAALTVFFPVDRYRLPALVAGVILVGVAGAQLPVLVREADRKRLLQSGGLVLACAGLAFAPIGTPDPAAGHVNVAVALDAQGAGATAVEARLQRALSADAEHGPANEMLGRLLLAEGAHAEALTLLTRAASDGRTWFSAQVAALPAMVALGRAPDAWRAAQGLLAERGDDPELLANAAVCASAVGRRSAAFDLLGRARAIAPTHPAVLAAAAAVQ